LTLDRFWHHRSINMHRIQVSMRPRLRYLEPAIAFEEGDAISLESLIRTNRGFVHQTEVQLLGVVQSILDQFVTHVETHPFEDSRGRYFDLKPS
jgi:hypothetical protein